MAVTPTHIPTEILRLLTAQEAAEYRLVPFAREAGRIRCYGETGHDYTAAAEELEVLYGWQVEVVPITADDLQRLLLQHYRPGSQTASAAAGRTAEIGQGRQFLFALVGEALHIPAEDVLPASTGVIGQPMVIDPFARGIPAAAAKLTAAAQGSTDAATAIMTTDTHKKEYAIQFELGGKTCTVGAIGKGSGMIAPNMATMLAFYTTDAAVSPALLEKALKTVVPGTYNQMSVDLDTSTNDTLIIMASGLAGNPEICEENADYDAFVAALTAIAEHMCAEHAGDGEGATHLITCEVTHAPDLKTARAVSRSVVCSNLFKAAVFGRDANWGRILCAIGYTPGDFSIDKVCVWLSSAAGEVYVCENAAYHPYSEEDAAKVLAEHDVLVKVDMGTGDASAKAWGCDLTYDYVKINGDYRT